MVTTERVLENIDFYPGQYCVTSVLGTYCKYYGLDLFTDLLGRYWEFDFQRNCSKDFFDEDLIEYQLNPMMRTYTQVLQEEFGVVFENLEIRQNQKEFFNQLKDYINRGFPIIVSIDPYYLQHYENYKQYHGLNWNHYIIVYGYSDLNEKIYFIDATRAFMKGPKHEINYHMFYEGVFPNENIYRLPCELVVMTEIKEEHLNSGKPLNFKNVHQIRDLAKEMRLLGTHANEQFLKQALVKILNQVVLISQHRWGNKGYVQKYIDPQNTQVDQIARCWDRIKYALSPIRKKPLNEKFLTVAEYIEEVADLEEVFHVSFAGK